MHLYNAIVDINFALFSRLICNCFRNLGFLIVSVMESFISILNNIFVHRIIFHFDKPTSHSLNFLSIFDRLITNITFVLLTMNRENERKISSQKACDLFMYFSIFPIILIYVFSNVLCCLHIVIILMIILIEIFIFLYLLNHYFYEIKKIKYL